MEDFQNNESTIDSTKHISVREMSDLRGKMIQCKIETGLNSYQNYVWPTTLSFLDF